MKILGLEVERIGHDCFKISHGGKVIYFDPYNIRSSDEADVIFVTHDHFDHCSIDDMKKLVKDGTMIVAPKECFVKITHMWPKSKTLILSPGQTHHLEGVSIEAVPAYNVDKFASPGKHFHPKQDGKLGYVVTFGGRRIYHAGDTDKIPEMEKLEDIDMALLPVSGTYVMTAEEAAEAADTIKPKVAVPMHYDSIVGTRKDAEMFKKLARCRVEIV